MQKTKQRKTCTKTDRAERQQNERTKGGHEDQSEKDETM